MIAARDRIIARLFGSKRFRSLARKIARPGCTAFLGMTPDNRAINAQLAGVREPQHAEGVLVAYLMDRSDRVVFEGTEPVVALLTRSELHALGI
jgi:hypothetical protein